MQTHRGKASLSLVVGANLRDVDDADLARGLVAGEAWAIAETWHRFAPMVLTMAQRSMGARAEAEEIAQEVFCCVFRKAKTLRDPACLRSFIYSFALRVVKAELRRRKVRGWLPFLRVELPPDAGVRMPDLESREALRKLYVLLDRLTPRDRLVFVLRRMEAKTVDEISTALDISASTVKRSIAHAASRLSVWIAADDGLAALIRDRKRGV